MIRGIVAGVVLVGCGGQARSVPGDDCRAIGGDAGPTPDTGLALCVDLDPTEAVRINSLLPRSDSDYELPVVSVRRGATFPDSIDIDLGGLEGDPSDPEDVRIALHFPAPEIGFFDLPAIGSTVVARSDQCWARIEAPDGELVWEGGSPLCSDRFGGRIGSRPDPDAAACRLDPDEPPECCCSTRRDRIAVLHGTGCDEVLPFGEERRLQIGGRSYVAIAYSAFRIGIGPCVSDGDGADSGHAYVGRLAP